MKRTGPDSLNSWMIAAGCCFINMMMFGMARLSGVLFVASVPRFQVTREQASFPYTLSQATRNSAGPLVGYLGQKFGVRLITLLGCLIAAAGIGTCYLAEDINTVTILWGIIFGLGFGMGNILLPISINQYFDKKRATASGISFSGACIGSFAIPPIVELLINNYGLSGTFLFLSGFVLNCVPAALLLRKPSFTIKTQQLNEEKDQEKQCITDGKKIKLYTVEDPVRTIDLMRENPFRFPPVANFEQNSSNKNIIPPVEANEDLNSKHLHPNYLLFKANECKDESKATSRQTPSDHTDSDSNPSKSTSHESTKCPSPDDSNECLYSKSYQGFYTNLAFQAVSDENCPSKHKEFCDRSSSFAPSVTTSFVKNEKESDFRAFNVIFDPMFILIALTNALYSAMFVCMITVIVDFARDLNVGETNEKYILMSLSVGDFIGRLGLGWITDCGYLSRSNFAAVCFLFQAITTVMVAWSTGLAMLLAMAALYGLSEAGLILIFPLLVAEFIEEDKQTVAIPSSYFLSGPLCLTVAPLIGFFRDKVGSYAFIFYGIGIISIICSLCWLLAPCISSCRRRKNR